MPFQYPGGGSASRVRGLGALRLPGQFRRAWFGGVEVRRTLFSCGSDVLFIDPNRKVLVFRRTVGGVVYEASISTDGLVPGEEVTAAVRWTSREAELVRLDEEENEEPTPRFTLDVWLNGVKGEPTVSTEGYFGDLYIGSEAGAHQLGSEMLARRVWRQVLASDEVVAEMAAL